MHTCPSVPRSPNTSADTSDNKAEEKQKLKTQGFQLQKHQDSLIQVNYYNFSSLLHSNRDASKLSGAKTTHAYRNCPWSPSPSSVCSSLHPHHSIGNLLPHNWGPLRFPPDCLAQGLLDWNHDIPRTVARRAFYGLATPPSSRTSHSCSPWQGPSQSPSVGCQQPQW